MTGFIGILTLDTAFDRILGDAGNPDSYHLPAKAVVVQNAGSTDIVRNGKPDPVLLAAFCEAAQKLEAEGAIALTSTCGFLVTAQDDIARSVSIPVMVSALSLFPVVQAIHGGRPIGILTASSEHLGPAVLGAVNIQPDQVVIAGLQDVPEFAASILVPKSQQVHEIRQTEIQSAVVTKARHLCQSRPDIGAFLLECGNLPPYARAIEDATGKPVYSILDGARILTQ